MSASNLDIMPTPGIFGETSAEVCGMFVAQAEATDVGVTGLANVTVSAGALRAANKKTGLLQMQTVTVPTGTDSTTVTLSSTADYFFVAGAKVENGSTTKTINRADGSTQYFRAITQTGNMEASICVIKVVFR